MIGRASTNLTMRLVARSNPMAGLRTPQPSILVPKAEQSSFVHAVAVRCAQCGCSGQHVCKPAATTARRLHTNTHEVKVTHPDEALELLRAGNKRFVSGSRLTPNQSLDRVKAIASGQTPYAAFLACADSRVPVEIIFDQVRVFRVCKRMCARKCVRVQVCACARARV
jgi:hypothetical protein